MERLIVTKGADEGKQFDLLLDQITIGRDSSNRLRLHDTEVSRRHAELQKTPDGYRILDVGSANGTYVNNRAIRDVLLRPGDQVQIGQTILLFTQTSAGGANLAAARASRKEQAARTPPATPPTPARSLFEEIDLITRHELLPSDIVNSVNETEGSRLLSRPNELEGRWLRTKLGIFYEAMQAVSQILDLDSLLNRLMDLIFKEMDADRGCMMLRQDVSATAGDSPLDEQATLTSTMRWSPNRPLSCSDLQPIAIRRRRVSKGPREEDDRITVSRTIMEYVLREKKGVLVSDAARDERFCSVQSIVHFGVREVICVPMRGRHETIGLLYLDFLTPTRNMQPGGPHFTNEHLALAITLAHQAALAVEDTRYHKAMLDAERLAAVGHTIAAMSHHIKNILQGLRSGSEIMKMGLNERDFDLIHQGWKIVGKNQGKIYDLVMDMLSYSKEREPVIRQTNLNEIIEDVAELLAGRAKEKGIQFEWSADAEMPQAWIDHDAIHRALLNIVGNALDAVEEVESPCVKVACRHDADTGCLKLTVEDNGPGIPPERLDEVFHPFVSSKGARGTGLGLAVSRKILREHGGDIEVQSEVGKGSIFCLRLPLQSTQMENVATNEYPTRTDDKSQQGEP
jgi:signal transduction histidine kinase